MSSGILFYYPDFTGLILLILLLCWDHYSEDMYSGIQMTGKKCFNSRFECLTPAHGIDCYWPDRQLAFT